MVGGWSSREKVMSVSDPRRYSGVAGCEDTARKTCLVTCFCLSVGWSSFLYHVDSTICLWVLFFFVGVMHRSWMAATYLSGAAGAGGALWEIVPTATLVRGCGVGAVDRLFSSESSV